MAPRPHSDKTSLPVDCSHDIMPEIPSQALPETLSPLTLSETTSSPTLQDQVLIELLEDTAVIQETNRMLSPESLTPCYPTPGDIMPYDHSLPDFIRQISNQPNLANLHSLRLRVISTLISLHRMSTYLPNLRELDLEGSILNSLRDIGCNFKNLHILKVGRCQLESLDGTFGLSSLRELYAQKNFINDISPCSNLSHIRHIDVSSNRIRNISYAGFLSVCKKLKSIVFTGNPATEVPNYRKHVRRILPNIEILDGDPLVNEENIEKLKETEMLENDYEESDSSSTGVPDFLSVSPSVSMNNFFEPEEDLVHLKKKNKQAKNLANLDQTDFADTEIQNLSPDIKINLQLQEDFQNLNFHQSKVKKGLLKQAKIIENRNANMKQKCVSIQKLDKDNENISKKSNLLLNANVNEELILSPDFSKSSVLEGSNFCLPSTSASVANIDDLIKTQATKKQSTMSFMTFELPYKVQEDKKAEETKFGTIKKISSSVSKAAILGEDQLIDHNQGPSTLTTGQPICGNLTAALRSRKKIMNKPQNYLSKRLDSQDLLEADEGKKPESQANELGDCFDAHLSLNNEDDLIEEDVLTTSKNWREAFRRFRSNNRARWEEEDKSDRANFPREESIVLNPDRN